MDIQYNTNKNSPLYGTVLVPEGSIVSGGTSVILPGGGQWFDTSNVHGGQVDLWATPSSMGSFGSAFKSAWNNAPVLSVPSQAASSPAEGTPRIADTGGSYQPAFQSSSQPISQQSNENTNLFYGFLSGLFGKLRRY